MTTNPRKIRDPETILVPHDLQADPNVIVDGKKMTLEHFIEDMLSRHPEFAMQLEEIRQEAINNPCKE